MISSSLAGCINEALMHVCEDASKIIEALTPGNDHHADG